MDGRATSISIFGLMCDDGEGCLLERSNGADERLKFGDEIDGEYVEMLIDREVGDDVRFKGLGFDSDPFDRCLEKSSNRVVDARRLDAINWMLIVRALFGFKLSTVFLAMTYFDQFISRQSINNGMYWVVRLLSVACLSVAAKMEEEKVPTLSAYPLGDFVFDKCAIQRMEVLVLSTLEWKMAFITPFAYFSYFFDKFYGDLESKPNDQDIVKATELVMEMLQEMSLMSRRPSSLAAAAILAAVDLQLNEKDLEVKLGLIRPSRSLKNEEIISLFRFLQELEKKKCKTSEVEILPSWSLGCSIAGTKRQLSYDCNDKDHENSSKRMHQ